jgi:DNA invertase Pin-like site-specific DNA recombinase
VSICSPSNWPNELGILSGVTKFRRSERQQDENGPATRNIHEGVDTSTPNGRLVFGIFASIAEFERELIRERVRSGITAAKSQGCNAGTTSGDCGQRHGVLFDIPLKRQGLAEPLDRNRMSPSARRLALRIAASHWSSRSR